MFKKCFFESKIEISICAVSTVYFRSCALKLELVIVLIIIFFFDFREILIFWKSKHLTLILENWRIKKCLTKIIWFIRFLQTWKVQIIVVMMMGNKQRKKLNNVPELLFLLKIVKMMIFFFLLCKLMVSVLPKKRVMCDF